MTSIKTRNAITSLLFLLALCISLKSNAQSSLTGKVVDGKNNPLENAVVYMQSTNASTFTDENGNFTFDLSGEGLFTIQIYLMGYETLETTVSSDSKMEKVTVQFTLLADPLELSQIVVTGNFNQRTKLESSTAVSTLSSEEIKRRGARGTADLLKGLTGTFADGSTGEVFTRVYSRGISISADDDLGWYYVSLQEDGLPITSTQHVYYGPDLFHRVDLTTKRLEAIRGGSASITNHNAPGGTYNFISKLGGNERAGEVLLTTAIQGDGRGLYRMDGNFSGPIGKRGWNYNMGGFYRYDEGARNVDVNWSEGGQIKFNLSKSTKSGFIKVYGKYLNDKVNRWSGLAAIDWNNPKAAFDQNFNHSALMLPALSTQIADGRTAGNDANATFDYNPNNGIHTEDIAVGFDISQSLGSGWTIHNNVKLSSKRADWQTSIGNQPLGLAEFTPYLLNGISPDFSVIPLGQIVFRYPGSSEVVARVNNYGILGPFSGQEASFEYLEGSLPNDALLGIAPWKKEDTATELMDQFTISKDIENHALTLGSYFAYSDVSTFTSGSFAYATYEAQPRMLVATLENPGEPIVHLSDPTGISNYGGLFYGSGKAQVIQSAFFLNDLWKINKKLSFDGGLRYEFANHEGEKDRSAPVANDLDDDVNTAYNNSTLVATGEVDKFDFNYSHLSWSGGLNYSIDKQTAVFGRFSKGHKTPELNYYFNNFQNLPIPEAGATQNITQVEMGIKWFGERLNVFGTAFWSRLDNVNFSEFVFDEETGQLFFTPAQLNETETIGLELESRATIYGNLELRLVATLQNAKAKQFTIYDANGTADDTDDITKDYSGNELPHNPKVSFEISPTYQANQWSTFFTWRYMGARQANVANAFQLPAFSTFNMGLIIEPSRHWNISIIANNIFNSAGLMNFFGPNEFGSSSNAATPKYIAENPEASFVVFPIVPRTIQVGIGYTF